MKISSAFTLLAILSVMQKTICVVAVATSCTGLISVFALVHSANSVAAPEQHHRICGPITEAVQNLVRWRSLAMPPILEAEKKHVNAESVWRGLGFSPSSLHRRMHKGPSRSSGCPNLGACRSNCNKEGHAGGTCVGRGMSVCYCS